jgi:hypothetical protein
MPAQHIVNCNCRARGCGFSLFDYHYALFVGEEGRKKKKLLSFSGEGIRRRFGKGCDANLFRSSQRQFPSPEFPLNAPSYNNIFFVSYFFSTSTHTVVLGFFGSDLPALYCIRCVGKI